jgi:tetratricopeptide (TPR) repeat protein
MSDQPGRGVAATPARRVLLTAAVVVGFFALAEAALGLAGVRPLLDERDPFSGFSSSVRVFEKDPARGLFVTSERAAAHSFNAQEFAAEKPAGSFRVFTLGGSSAYGFPRGGRIAFPRILGEALRAAYPARTIESINAAGMSYGSRRMRVVAAEVAGYAPDAIVVFEGHNEFVETRFFRDEIARSRALDPARALLYRWRLYSALTRVLAPPVKTVAAPPGAPGRAAAGGAPERIRDNSTGPLLGIDVAREDRPFVGDREKEEVRAFFERNLRALVEEGRRAGASVVLCTVPSNVRDWRPNQSAFEEAIPASAREEAGTLLGFAERMMREGRAAEAAGALERARAIAPGHAMTRFALGRSYESLGRWEEAKAELALARDLDAQPTRATTAINDTIRRVAAGGGALLVDVERAFEKEAPHGLVGFDLVEDYVHPTPAGHRLVARELYRAFVESGVAGAARAPDEAAFDTAAARVDAEAAEGGSADPKTPELLFNQAIVLENQGLTEQAMAAYRECLTLAPGHYAARCNLGWTLYENGQVEEALTEFDRGLADAPDHVNCLLGRGQALAAVSRPGEAERDFARAAGLDPSSSLAWNGLGLALAQQGKIPEAIERFRRAVERDPKDPEGMGNLGQALLSQGSTDEAIDLFRRALAIQHDHPRSRVGLAAALMEKKSYAEAEEIYREILASDPADPYGLRGMEEIRAATSGRSP